MPYVPLFSQSINSMEFYNQEITDILLVLAESSGTSIIPDETVSGKASFYFSDSSLEVALDTFLSTYNLYYEKNDSYISVSRIMVDYNQDSQLFSVKAKDVKIEFILDKLSKKMGKTILYDALPSASITLDILDLPIEEILKICIRKFPDFSIESDNSYYYVKRNETKTLTTRTKEYIKKEDNLYSISLEKGSFLEIIKQLFKLEEIEFSLFVNSDIQIENLYLSGKDFLTMLNLILEQGNAHYIEKNGIYYVMDLPKKGITSRIVSTQVVPLQWISAQDIYTLIPTEISSSSVIKIDKINNSVLLTGSDIEVAPILNFIKQVDIPASGIKYKRVDLKYLNATEAISLIPAKMMQQNPAIVIPNSNSILVSGSEETLAAVEKFIENIDIKVPGKPIKLKYIQKETLMGNLPPSIAQEDLIDSGFPNLLFYIGSEEKMNLFLHELNQIDKPQPQIKYQLLVIQYSDGASSSIKNTINITPSTSSESFIFDGELSNVMDLTFDIISNFGYQFASNLNTRISNNTANVFTDTTLTAISGQEVKFQNTDTYRYIEYDYDSSSTTRSSITQQITSGLIVSLNGWISGDNMITMSVNATISKQNSDGSTSSSSSVLPSTSERVVTTQVRTMSGEPVVISGLIKEDISKTKSKIPFLGDIPLLGHLFKHTTTSKDKTEIVIYIVPHLIQDTGIVECDELNIERYYQNYMGI